MSPAASPAAAMEPRARVAVGRATNLAASPVAVAATRVPAEPGPAKAQVAEAELATVRATALGPAITAATTASAGMPPAMPISRCRAVRKATSPQRRPAQQLATRSA